MPKKAVYLTPIFDPYVGGAAVHFGNLIEGLIERGSFESFVVLTAYSSDAPIYESRPAGRIFRILFSPNSIHCSWSKSKVIINYFISIIATITIIMLLRADFVHTHTKKYLSPAVKLARLLRLKIVIDGRDLGAPDFSATGDVFVAASENIAEKSHSRRERVVKIPIGIDPDELILEYDDVSLSDEEYFLFVGDIVDRKGVTELLDAYNSSQYDRRLILIGEHIDQSIDLDQSDDIQYLGTLPHTETLRYIRMADLLLLPSKEEGLPRVVLEAIFYETPVLCPPIVPEFQRLLPEMTIK